MRGGLYYESDCISGGEPVYMKPLDYILIVVLAIIVGLALYFTIRNAKRGKGCCGGGCGGDCSKCPMKCGNNREKSSEKNDEVKKS